MTAAPRTRPLFFSACAGMFVFGIVIAVLGTVFGLPETRARLHVDLAQQGQLFLILYLGVFLANLVVGPLIDAIGNKWILLCSALLVAAAMAGFASAQSFASAAFAGLVLGFGGGGLNTSTNALVSDLYAEKRGAMLNLLGVFFGFGALFMPLVAASITGRFAVAQQLLAAAALALACALLYLALPFPARNGGGHVSLMDTLRVARYPGVLLMGVLLFFQSGNEASIGGWTSTYVGAAGLAPRTATLVLSGYWAALMLGRIFAAPALSRVSKGRMILASGIGSAVGCVVLLAAHSVATLALGTVIIGFSFSAIFPTALGMAGDRYPQSAGSVFGLLFAMALLGGMISPWAVGRVSQSYAVRFGMFVPLIGTVLICLTARLLARSEAAQLAAEGKATAATQTR